MRALALTLALAGCAGPLDAATAAANASGALSASSEAVFKAVCTDSVHSSADVARLDPYCLPVRQAIASHESAWRNEEAAIVAVSADPTMPDANALLADRAASLAASRKALARAIEGVH